MAKNTSFSRVLDSGWTGFGFLLAHAPVTADQVKLELPPRQPDGEPVPVAIESVSAEGSKLSIKTADCVRCMHCINTMPRALHIGDERGASILVGAKAPVVDGAQMGSLLVPFISCEAPYDEIKEVIEKIWDWWMEEGKNRERVGETMKRLSFQKLLEVTDTEAAPYHVTAPRSNPYIFFKEEEVPGGWNRDLAEFRKRHQR